MKLENIYEKNINRHIDPAVVVGSMEEERTKQEIEEYVFTKDILQNIYKFLDAIVNKTTGKTGIWINGYYGSGKSHFIKYLFYCLNQNTRQRALQRYIEAVKDSEDLDDFSEVTPSNVLNIEKKISASVIDEIIFNIDAVAEIGNKKSVITRVLLQQLNIKRGFYGSNIAFAILIEKQLQKKGCLEAFRERVSSVFDVDWEDNKIRDLLHLRKAKLIDIVAEFDENIDKISLAEALNDNREYTIEELISEFKEYVEEKSTDDYRLIFLMDEVSQYIGTNSSLLLNLQTIVEGVGINLGQKVWIVCTAQQDLSSLVNRNKGKEDGFGKIMGRFETMISLDSQDTKYITQKRLLEKNAEGSKALVDFYQKNKGGIQNQFEFAHSLYKNFQDAEEFYLSYPFVPYQFRLISDVFQSFSSIGFVGEGIKNTERSILGIIHFTAKKQSKREFGYFISFDDFYNDQLSKNLTHMAKSVLDRALNIDFDEDIRGFAHRVAKALFMISHLDDSLKINFPATVENIALLLINHISEVKVDIEKKVEIVLNQLIKSNIIQESEGKYRFLNNDGILVANIIANTIVPSNVNLKYFYDQFIQKLIKPQSSYNLGNRNIKVGISIDDKVELQNGDIGVKFVVFDGDEMKSGVISSSIRQEDLYINIFEWLKLDENKSFLNGFYKYAKTAKFLDDNKSTATGERVRTLEDFANDNNRLLSELQVTFEKKFSETSYISQQQINKANTIAVTIPSQRYAQMLDRHVKAIYNKYEWSNKFAKNNEELRKATSSTQINGDLYQSSIAEEDVNTTISRKYDNKVNLVDLVKYYDKAPYGWKDIAVLDIVYKLVIKKHRAFYYLNEELDPKKYYELAINSSSRAGIEICSPKKYNQEEINDFCTAVQDIFLSINLSPTLEPKQIIETFKKNLEEILIEVNTDKKEYEGYPFYECIKNYHLALKYIMETGTNEGMMQKVIAQKETLKQQRDEYAQIKDFIMGNISRYNDIKEFLHQNKNNLERLGEKEEQSYAEQYKEIKNFMETEKNPALQFPIVLKQYRTLKKAIEDLINALRNQVIEIYTKIFDELENSIEEKEGVAKNIIPERSAFLVKIENTENYNELEVWESKSTDFRVQYLKAIAEAEERINGDKPGKTLIKEVNITKKISGKILTTPEEVEQFLSGLRNSLMVELGKTDSKIILK